ncbi:MAG: DUF3301 domain-containing protein [Cellvibrionaceae bacterium]
MTLNDIFLFTLVAIVVYFFWTHANMSRVARAAARRYCEKEGVQFLDQNVLLKNISIKPSPHSLFALRRAYRFEFSSVGDTRYEGNIFLMGNRIEHIELQPYKTYS